MFLQTLTRPVRHGGTRSRSARRSLGSGFVFMPEPRSSNATVTIETVAGLDSLAPGESRCIKTYWRDLPSCTEKGGEVIVTALGDNRLRITSRVDDGYPTDEHGAVDTVFVDGRALKYGATTDVPASTSIRVVRLVGWRNVH